MDDMLATGVTFHPSLIIIFPMFKFRRDLAENNFWENGAVQ